MTRTILPGQVFHFSTYTLNLPISVITFLVIVIEQSSIDDTCLSICHTPLVYLSIICMGFVEYKQPQKT